MTKLIFRIKILLSWEWSEGQHFRLAPKGSIVLAHEIDLIRKEESVVFLKVIA